jgi:hypothetical protein
MEPGSYHRADAAKSLSAVSITDLDPQLFETILVRRLKRALLLRFYTEPLITEHDRRLLDHVIYAAYCDCLAVGLGTVARSLLAEARSGSGLFRRPSSGSGGGSRWSI